MEDFSGFCPEAVDFLWGIRFNNERPWFEARKDIYLRALYRPMQALGQEVYRYLSRKRPQDPLVCRVSRIYRDARRLHGRGPYKDHLWFCVEPPAEDHAARPAFWFELGPEYWSYGLGCWMARPADMARLRQRIRREPEPMAALTDKLRRQREFSLSTETYRRPKAGCPQPELLAWFSAKNLALCHEEALIPALYSRALLERLKKGYRFLLPFYDYFLTLPGEPLPETLE